MSDTERSDLLWAVRSAEDGPTPKRRGVASYALASPTASIRNTAKDSRAELATSEPTLIRLRQGFGYGGLADRIDLASALAQRTGAIVVEPTAHDRRRDTFVMGADGVDPTVGLSTLREDEAHRDRAMIEACERVVVLEDRSKFLKPCLHSICPIEKVAAIVTDLSPGDDMARRIADRGVRLISTNEEEDGR